MKKIIFDLDDTLYVNKELRAKRNRAILDFLNEKGLEFIKLKNHYNTIESLGRLGVSKGEFYNLMEKVDINLRKDIKLIRLLDKLKERYELIVLSNSSRYCVEQTLKKLGIQELINNFYCGEDFEFIKPHEECFSMVQKGDFCIGNNFEKDLRVPKEKGAITILVGRDNSKADYNINNIYQLKQLFNKINTN